jgi:hypothetical protein
VTDLATKLEQLEARAQEAFEAWWLDPAADEPEPITKGDAQEQGFLAGYKTALAELKDLVGRARLEEAKWWDERRRLMPDGPVFLDERPGRIAELEAAIGRPPARPICTKCSHAREAHEIEPPYPCNGLDCDCQGFSYAQPAIGKPAGKDFIPPSNE